MKVPVSTKLFGFDFEMTWSAVLILAIIVIQSAGDGSEVSRLLEGVVWCGVIFVVVGYPNNVLKLGV